MDHATVLRELVHRAHGRLVREPELHVKRALGLHAHEDALSVTDLGGPAGPPADDLPGDAYTDLKPALAAAARRELARLDPVAEEPRLRVLVALVLRQERHLAERPARRTDNGEPPEHVEPAREPFLRRGADTGTHAELNAALLVAEAAAQTAHDHPELAWKVQVDLARVVAERLDETALLEARLAEEDRHWGDRPVALDAFGEAMALDLPDRLAYLTSASSPSARAAGATRMPPSEGGSGPSGWTSRPAHEHSSAPAATSQGLTPRS